MHTYSVDGGYPINIRASADDIMYAGGSMIRGPNMGGYATESTIWASRPAKPGTTALVTAYSDGMYVCMYVCICLCVS